MHIYTRYEHFGIYDVPGRRWWGHRGILGDEYILGGEDEQLRPLVVEAPDFT